MIPQAEKAPTPPEGPPVLPGKGRWFLSGFRDRGWLGWRRTERAIGLALRPVSRPLSSGPSPRVCGSILHGASAQVAKASHRAASDTTDVEAGAPSQRRAKFAKRWRCANGADLPAQEPFTIDGKAPMRSAQQAAVCGASECWGFVPSRIRRRGCRREARACPGCRHF